MRRALDARFLSHSRHCVPVQDLSKNTQQKLFKKLFDPDRIICDKPALPGQLRHSRAIGELGEVLYRRRHCVGVPLRASYAFTRQALEQYFLLARLFLGNSFLQYAQRLVLTRFTF